jgi:hypothetical protein
MRKFDKIKSIFICVLDVFKLYNKDDDNDKQLRIYSPC